MASMVNGDERGDEILCRLSMSSALYISYHTIPYLLLMT